MQPKVRYQATTLDRKRVEVIASPIDVLDWAEAVERLRTWAQWRASRYVCICNAHSVVTAFQDPPFAEVVRLADMVAPDGAPVAWMMRRMGHPNQQRIDGPDLMWSFCKAAKEGDPGIFLYGSTDETLRRLEANLLANFPALRIAGRYAPPFRELNAQEDDAVVQMINSSGAGIVWVGLGCPKQEFWMAGKKGRIDAVMVGVGAAFSIHAGNIHRAPLWMRNAGLEWLHRLAREPRRLWRRYLVTNTLFILKAAQQLAAHMMSSRTGARG